MSVGIEEQETVIGFMRDEEFCTVYTSDSTVLTNTHGLARGVV